MRIREVTENKKQYLDLLLLADEQEDMIDRYLEQGTMFVLEAETPQEATPCQGATPYSALGECVVLEVGDGLLEVKNIATDPSQHGKGYGRMLLDYVADHFKKQYDRLQVGTGDSPLTVPFYEKCGFTRSHVLKNFFTDNYDHPIYECGVQLVDMIYLEKQL